MCVSASCGLPAWKDANFGLAGCLFAFIANIYMISLSYQALSGSRSFRLVYCSSGQHIACDADGCSGPRVGVANRRWDYKDYLSEILETLQPQHNPFELLGGVKVQA